MSRTTEAQKLYMRSYIEKPGKRKQKQKRENDLNKFEKKNGKIPVGKELHHTGDYAKGPTRVIKKKTNRALGAKLTNKVRKKVN